MDYREFQNLELLTTVIAMCFSGFVQVMFTLVFGKAWIKKVQSEVKMIL